MGDQSGRSQSRSTSEMTPEEYEQWLRDTPLSFRGRVLSLNEGEQRAVDRITRCAYAGGDGKPEEDVRYLLMLLDTVIQRANGVPHA